MKPSLLCAVTIILIASPFRAKASSYLFTSTGAGMTAITVGTGVTALTANNDSITAPSSTDVALAFANTGGAHFSSTGPATFTGIIDFSDAASKTTGGTCTANAGSVCTVDSSSSLGNTTVTGVTQQNNSAVTAAVNEWNALIDATTGWSSVAGTNAVLTNGGTLCVGTATGCTATAASTTTLTIDGQSQTAYVFNVLTTGNSGHIGGAVSINGNNTGSLVVLNYVASQNGGNALQVNKAFTLAGGLTDDQVLLNIESGGLVTSGGYSFNGAVAIRGTQANLDNSTTNGRLYIDITGSSTIQSGFDLTAPADVPGSSAPEPGTILLSGLALSALYSAGQRRMESVRAKLSATAQAAA